MMTSLSLLHLALLLALLSPDRALAAKSAVTSDGRILQDETVTSVPTSAPVTSSPTASSSPTAERIPTTAAPVQAIPGPWGGCVNPLDPDEKLRRGARTPVCLTVGPGGDWNRIVDPNPPPGDTGGVEYMRYTFTPQADEYSVYRLPNSFQNFIVKEEVGYLLPNITVFSASGKGISFLRHWYEKDVNNTADGKVFPHLTAIIDVKNGDVKGITWDNACIFCKSSLCIENTYDFNGNSAVVEGRGAETRGCYLTYQQCEVIHAGGGNECDLTIFVVWTGSDADGNVMSSSNSRFSAFEPRQIQDRWGGIIKDSVSSVTDKINDAKDTVTGTIDGATDSVSDFFGGEGEEEGEGEEGSN